VVCLGARRLHREGIPYTVADFSPPSRRVFNNLLFHEKHFSTPA